MASDLTVRLLGDDSDLRKTLNESAKDAAKWSAAVAAAAALATAAIVASTSAQVKELTVLSRAANTSVSDFQRMAFAASQYGAEQEQLAGILKDFNDRIGDFNQTGAGPMVDFFERIAPKVGVTAENFKNLSGPQALQLYVSSLEKANLSQADMVFFMETMSSESTDLIPLLAENGRQMALLADEAKALGLGLSEIDATKIENAANQASKMGVVFDSLTQQLAVQFAPVIDEVAGRIISAATESKAFKTAIQDAFNFVIDSGGTVADVFFHYEKAIKVVELAYRQLEITASVTARSVVDQWVEIGDFIDSFINDAIRTLNSFPGVNMDEVVTGDSEALATVTNWAEGAKKSFDETRGELANLVSQELPSVAFKKFIEDAEKASEAAAEAAVKARESAKAVEVPELGKPKAESKADELLRKDLESRLEVIREANLTEQELANEKLLADLETLSDGNQQKLLTDEEYLIQKMDLQKRFDDEAKEQAQKAADKQTAIEVAAARARLNVASGAFGNLSTLMNTENKKLFEIGKIAALAQATIDGYAAVQSSYAQGAKIGGPAVGAAFAATAAVATAVQISGIASTSFGGGGGSVSAPGGGAPSVSDQTTSGGAGSNDTSRSLLIQGDFSSESLFTGDAVRSLIEKIAEQQADGFTVVS